MKVFYVVLFTVILLVSAGCQQNKIQNLVPNNQKPMVKTPDEEKRDGYSIVKASTLPKEPANWFNTFGIKRGAYVYQHPDNTYLKVNSGGNESINIVSFNIGETEKKLTVDFSSSNKGESSIILKVPSKYVSNYKVVNTKNEELTVEQKVVNAAFEMPKENQVIDNPVRIKGKIAAFEGAFIARIIDGNGKTIKEERLQTAGAPAWGSFDAQVKYPVPQTNTGRIELGEYSAKDGSYIMHAKVDVKFKK